MTKKSSILVWIVAAVALCASPSGAFAHSQPFIGRVMVVGFDFCPAGWLPMNGALLPISNTAYQPLFDLLGATYGGNGTTNFALPIAKPTYAVSGATFIACIAYSGVFPSRP